jgi:hypothetical protein
MSNIENKEALAALISLQVAIEDGCICLKLFAGQQIGKPEPAACHHGGQSLNLQATFANIISNGLLKLIMRGSVPTTKIRGFQRPPES